MKPVYVWGIGAVSPAGWSVAELRHALAQATPLPTQDMPRPGWEKPLTIRPVPAPSPRPTFLSHPRLRRASPLSQYAAGAAMEATAKLPEQLRSGKIGLLFCLQSGPVQYASRFFEEAVRDPATASPLLFPETVFAAPASHIAVLLGNAPLAYTLMGDPGAFLHGLAIAATWLDEGRVETCLVIGAEEFNWLHANAVWHFDHRSIPGAGAGALCLTLERPSHSGVKLECVTDAHSYSARVNQRQATEAMRAQLPASRPDELLCDGVENTSRASAAEEEAWKDWSGKRLRPKPVLGEGLMAGGAWQCVAAIDALLSGPFSAANVSVVGCNQQAIGARFVKVHGDLGQKNSRT